MELYIQITWLKFKATDEPYIWEKVSGSYFFSKINDLYQPCVNVVLLR